MKILFTIVCMLLIGCKEGGDNHQTANGTDLLIIDMRDFSVRQALHQDSIYNETLLTLMNDDNMNEEEAVEFLKSMIESALLPSPRIVFYDKQSKLQMKSVSYEEFRKYINSIKARSTF